MAKRTLTINEAADYIIEQLGNEMIIHRYNAVSSNSVYLKFDYGVANSLRISDHKGKRNLAYRFNLCVDIEIPYKRIEDDVTRNFYPMGCIDMLIAQIRGSRKAKIEQYSQEQYDIMIQESMRKVTLHTPVGFWCYAKMVKDGGRRNERKNTAVSV